MLWKVVVVAVPVIIAMAAGMTTEIAMTRAGCWYLLMIEFHMTSPASKCLLLRARRPPRSVSLKSVSHKLFTHKLFKDLNALRCIEIVAGVFVKQPILYWSADASLAQVDIISASTVSSQADGRP